ncbi:MAG: nucleoside kinase, partial [Prevotella sp.]|nr:nucleoside kinase [Prevotella sp.]
MEKTIKIKILNNGQSYDVSMGSQLEDIYQQINLQMAYPPVIARVNNKVEGMHYRVYKNSQVEFLDITSTSGQRAYTRSLFFVLCKAAQDLYSPCEVTIDIPVSNGYYVDLNIGRPVTLEDAGKIRQRMQEIIDAAYPIHRHEATTEEAIKMFDDLHTHSKVKLL